jgi:hypothetical protein
MATAIVSIICIMLVVLGGMTMSQGVLTSADTTAFSIDELSTREGAMMRTGIQVLRAEPLSWADWLRVTVDNSGQTKLASFNKWDFIVHYDDGGTHYNRWLPYTTGAPGDNEWEKARICLNGQAEAFEPGILNPQEELVILAKLSPLPGNATTGDVTITTPNGTYDSISFSRLGYTLLVPHAENMTIAGAHHYQLAEATMADGNGTTEATDTFAAGETGRKILHDEDSASKQARYAFPLTGISQIPAATWTAYYRCQTAGFNAFQDNDIDFNMDIAILKADGTVRTTIATAVARAYLSADEVDTWVTKSATYDFPGYTVLDDSDYLEITYYGEASGYGPDSSGEMQIRIDDNTLAAGDQTRMEAP